MRASTAIITISALIGSAAASIADDNGVAGIHQWRKVAGRTCFVDHTHDGSGTGQSQKAAMANAIASWRSFTDLEYGSDWASYSNSIEKVASCTSRADGFECHVASTPCKGGVLVQLHQRRDQRHSVKRRHVAQYAPK